METAVQIEKEIDDLPLMPKLDRFINLANFYHLYCYQVEKCSNCYFILKVLEIWNAPTAQKLPESNSKKKC